MNSTVHYWFMQEYYDIQSLRHRFHIPLVEVVGPNYGSYHHIFTAFEKFGDCFDFYLLMEDDYVPYLHNFDVQLINVYNKRFPNSDGCLAGQWWGKGVQTVAVKIAGKVCSWCGHVVCTSHSYYEHSWAYYAVSSCVHSRGCTSRCMMMHCLSYPRS